MIATEKQKLETALGLSEPLPWPASLDEEIALAERNQANPIRDHTPRFAPGRKVRNVLSILDQIEKEHSNRRFNV